MRAMVLLTVFCLLGATAPGSADVGEEPPPHGGALERTASDRPGPAVRPPLPAWAPAFAADSTITIARLQYGGGGDWYADPSSLPNLLRAVRERTGVPTADREVTVSVLDPALRDHPYLYMTGHGNIRFSPEEREVLRDHLLAGGFLHADDNYGMDESFRSEMRAVFPDKELVPIPADHPVFHGVYDFPEGLPKIHEHGGEPARAEGIFHRGRLLVFYSFESDLGDGWEDPDVHGDPDELREAALRMGVNLFVFALSQVAP